MDILPLYKWLIPDSRIYIVAVSPLYRCIIWPCTEVVEGGWHRVCSPHPTPQVSVEYKLIYITDTHPLYTLISVHWHDLNSWYNIPLDSLFCLWWSIAYIQPRFAEELEADRTIIRSKCSESLVLSGVKHRAMLLVCRFIYLRYKRPLYTWLMNCIPCDDQSVYV